MKTDEPLIPGEKINDPKYSKEQIDACIALLQDVVQNSVELAHLPREQRIALLRAAGEISRPDREEIRKRKKTRIQLKRQKLNEHERAVRAATGIRSARQATVFTAPKQITHQSEEALELIKPRACYVCKNEFKRLHAFYDAMCPSCAEFNYAKRFQTASLHGQVALSPVHV